MPDEELDDGIFGEFEVTLGELLKKEGGSLLYRYDFGNNWEHEVVLEKVRSWREGTELPCCTVGAGGGRQRMSLESTVMSVC